MKDKLGQELKVKDLVLCVDPIEGFLLKDKVYEVKDLRESDGRVVLIPDERGMEGHYKSSRFERVKP